MKILAWLAYTNVSFEFMDILAKLTYADVSFEFMEVLARLTYANISLEFMEILLWKHIADQPHAFLDPVPTIVGPHTGHYTCTLLSSVKSNQI